MINYYKMKLSLREQSQYDLIMRGLLNLSDDIEIDNIEISAVVEALLLDNPQLFYFDGLEKDESSEEKVTIHPHYQYKKEEILYYQKEFERISSLINEELSGKDSYDKVLYVHDLFCRMINPKNAGFKSFSIIGAFVEREAVCAGISKAFKYLMNQENIDAVYTFGMLKNPDGTSTNHAWNKVKIDGEWYNVDITYDMYLNDRENIKYDCFLVSDETLRYNHFEESELQLPALSDRLSLFFKNGLSFEKVSDIYGFVVNKLLDNQKDIMFKIKKREMQELLEEELYRVIDRALDTVKLRYDYEIIANYDQQVFYIKFN